MKSAMKHALMNKKSKGIDLTIILGSPEEEKEEQKGSDLAPNKHMGESMDEQQPEDTVGADLVDSEKSEQPGDSLEMLLGKKQGVHDTVPGTLKDKVKKHFMMGKKA